MKITKNVFCGGVGPFKLSAFIQSDDEKYYNLCGDNECGCALELIPKSPLSEWHCNMFDKKLNGPKRCKKCIELFGE